MARTIVLGYDGSECAKEALDAAVDLARDQPGSRIIVVHGSQVDLVVGGGPMAAELIVPELEDVEPPAEASISTWLDEATARIAAAGVAVDSELKRESASAALLDVAEEESADMIVVGSHGAGALRGILFGSTPNRLLHHSRVPVLVVPHRH